MKEQGRVDENAPVESCARDLIERAHRNGAPWLLEAVKDAQAEGANGISIKFKTELPPHDEWEPPAALRGHEFEDIDSLVEYARRHTKAEEAVIFCSKTRISLVLNETVERGSREQLNAPLRMTREWEMWRKLFETPTNFKDLRDEYLPKLSHTMPVDKKLIGALRNIQYNEEVKIESVVTDNDATFGVTFTATGKQETIRSIPKKLEVRCPILEMDTPDAIAWVTLEVDVEVIMPRKQGDGLKIALLCPMARVEESKRLQSLTGEIKEDLGEGWLVVCGTPAYEHRAIGNEDRWKAVETPKINIVTPGPASSGRAY